MNTLNYMKAVQLYMSAYCLEYFRQNSIVYYNISNMMAQHRPEFVCGNLEKFQ